MSEAHVEILSAGAAKGLLNSIAAQEGIALVGEFGAVGAMRERLESGAACEIIVLTDAMIAALADAQAVVRESVVALGNVKTGVARLQGAARVSVADAAALSATLVGASKIYFPDPVRATAGIHVMKVLTALGLAEPLRERFATFPNGATAMRAMVEASDAQAIGLTQCSEMLYTAGVHYVGHLPGDFELTTGYSAALVSAAKDRPNASRLLAAVASAANVNLRRAAGFE